VLNDRIWSTPPAVEDMRFAFDVGVAVGVTVALGDGVAVGVPVGVTVLVGDDDGDGVGVAVGAVAAHRTSTLRVETCVAVRKHPRAVIVVLFPGATNTTRAVDAGVRAFDVLAEQRAMTRVVVAEDRVSSHARD
jgi:hypothetical protein